MSTQSRWRPYAAWVSLNLFFLYVYVLRVSSGVMFNELRQEFLMTGEQFGIFAACYLYSYSLMQVPFGVFLDRIGIRKVALFSGVMVLAALWFLTQAYSLYAAYASRILLGFGSASVFMSALKFVSDRLPAKQRAVFMGLTLSTGTVGALLAGQFIPQMLQVYEWRDVVYIMIYGGLPIIALLFVFLPRHQKNVESANLSFDEVLHTVIAAAKNWHVILYGILSIGVYTPLAVIADSWGTAFLGQKYSWDASLAASTIMMMYVGLTIGSLMLPWLTKIWGDFNKTIQISLLCLFTLFALVLYWPQLASANLIVLLVIIGIFCGAEMMCFTGASHYTTPATSGVTLGVVNTFNMLGGALLNQIIGITLDLSWSGVVENELRVYSTKDYTTAFTVLLAMIGVCFLFSLQLKRPKANEFVKVAHDN